MRLEFGFYICQNQCLTMIEHRKIAAPTEKSYLDFFLNQTIGRPIKNIHSKSYSFRIKNDFDSMFDNVKHRNMLLFISI